MFWYTEHLLTLPDKNRDSRFNIYECLIKYKFNLFRLELQWSSSLFQDLRRQSRFLLHPRFSISFCWGTTTSFQAKVYHTTGHCISGKGTLMNSQFSIWTRIGLRLFSQSKEAEPSDEAIGIYFPFQFISNYWACKHSLQIRDFSPYKFTI